YSCPAACAFEMRGVTREDRWSGPCGLGPSLHRRHLAIGKSVARLSGGCEESSDDSQRDSAESMPARKASSSSTCGARTANRHWWATVSTVRRSREPSLRNSAIWLRNFGRRSAPEGERLRVSSARGPQ